MVVYEVESVTFSRPLCSLFKSDVEEVITLFHVYMTNMQNIVDFSDTICITLSNRMKHLHQLI